MRNYLARLGWSHGDDEIFSDDQAIEWFDIGDINRAPSRLDFAKLGHVNAYWLQKADDTRLFYAILPHLLKKDAQIHDNVETKETLIRVIGLIKARVQTVTELADGCLFAVATWQTALDEKSSALLTVETKSRIHRLADEIDNWPDWTLDTVERDLKNFVLLEGISFGKIGHILRKLLSNGCPAPDIARILIALGREISTKRLRSYL
jgi:glutamyl-tRNA synthetase